MPEPTSNQTGTWRDGRSEALQVQGPDHTPTRSTRSTSLRWPPDDPGPDPRTRPSWPSRPRRELILVADSEVASPAAIFACSIASIRPATANNPFATGPAGRALGGPPDDAWC